MFKLVTEIVAPWPVLVDVVREDGSVAQDEFTAQFVRMSESDFEALFAPIDALREDERKAHNRKMIDRIMRGWRDVVDGGGKALPFTPENVDRLLDFPNIGSAITLAYVRFHRAQPEEREKNSVPSPGGTPAAASSDAAETIAKG
ncbi:MAG: hypothetical protein ACK5SX_16225 [Sandaracinobacter sp.]